MFSPPPGRTRADTVHRIAGRPVGTQAGLIASQAPCAAGTEDGAVHALPACGVTAARRVEILILRQSKQVAVAVAPGSRQQNLVT